MRKLIKAAFILAAGLLAAGPAMAADPTIDGLETDRQAAWNAKDAGAYAAAFDHNAEIVTSLGWHWTGQAEAARNLGDGFKFIYAQAHLQLTVMQVRTLAPDLALVTLSWSITGARTIDTGSQSTEQHGFETQVLQRRGESWLILAQQDTAAAAPLPAVSSSPERTPAAVATFPKAAPPVRRCIVGRPNGQCLIYGKPAKAPAS